MISQPDPVSEEKRRRWRFVWQALRALAAVLLIYGVIQTSWSLIVDRDYWVVIPSALSFLFWIWIFRGCSRRLEHDPSRVL